MSQIILPGDHVILTSTDYDTKQAEEAILVDCLQCSDNEIRIDSKFAFYFTSHDNKR